MKAKFLLSVLVISIVLTGCAAKTLETNEVEIFGTYTKEEMIEDAEKLMTIIDSYSAKLYTDEEELRSEYQNAITLFEDDMTSRDFMQIMKPVVAALRCGHTHIYGNVDWDKIELMPLDIKVIDNQLYLIESAGDSKIPNGSRITAINGNSSDEILAEIVKGTSGDGYNTTGKIHFISRLFAREYMFNVEYANEFKIEYIGPDGKSGSDTVTSMKSNKVRSKLWDSFSKIYESEFTDNYAVLTIHSFNPNSRNSIDDYNEFFDKFFLEVEQKGIGNVILDLRGNSGGDPMITGHLFSYLLKTPQPYFAAESPNYYPTLKKDIQKADNHFSGNLYTLIDGGCFSTATHLISLLKYQEIGTFIGVETGGHFVCTDSSRDRTLPNTGLNFHYSTEAWAVAVEGQEPGRGIIPDFEIAPTLDNYLNDTDPAMDYAIILIKNE